MLATDATPLLWIGFGLFVALMMVLDLAVFHRRAHVVKPREALTWSLVWIGLSLAFAVLLNYWMGRQQALEFLTGWVIEKALSVDNLFVFIVIVS